jgi:hypothetical protein
MRRGMTSLALQVQEALKLRVSAIPGHRFR